MVVKQSRINHRAFLSGAEKIHKIPKKTKNGTRTITLVGLAIIICKNSPIIEKQEIKLIALRFLLRRDIKIIIINASEMKEDRCGTKYRMP